MLSPLLFSVFFAAALNAVFVRVGEDKGMVENLVHLDDIKAGRAEGAFACVRGAVCGMLCTDDAGVPR